MSLSFKYIVSISIFFSNYNIFTKTNICCPCGLCCKDEDDKKDDEDLNKDKNNDKDKKNNDDKKVDNDLNKDNEKENKYRIDFSKDDNRFKKGYNEKYNEILIKYLNNKSLDYNKCDFKVENIESQCSCRKVNINNDKVVYIKWDNYDNSFYIDLLKSLNYCDLEYLYQDGVILTEEVKNDYEIELKENFDREYFRKSKDILEKTENLLPYFTILSFLDFWDCGTLKLNNHIFKKQDNGKYLIKALDIDIKNRIYSKEGDNEDYYNFYFDLNTGFNMFTEIRLFVTQTFNSNDLDFKKFIIFINDSYMYFVETISEIFKGEVEELQDAEKSCFNNFIYNIFIKDNLSNFLNDELNYNGKFNDKARFNFLVGHYKNDFNTFLKDYVNYLLKNYCTIFKNDKRLKKVCKYLKIEEKDNYSNDEKVEIVLKLYQKLIERTKKTFELLFEYFEFYKYLGDKMKNITEKQEKEIKEKFDKMLEFLIKNKDNKKYNKDHFNAVVKNIKEVQKSNLFRFIFDDENIKNKINKLT